MKADAIEHGEVKNGSNAKWLAVGGFELEVRFPQKAPSVDALRRLLIAKGIPEEHVIQTKLPQFEVNHSLLAGLIAIGKLTQAEVDALRVPMTPALYIHAGETAAP